MFGFVFIACSAFGQSELSGRNLFPEFRTLSGLPGGTFGLTRKGAPSISGAMGISTPLAYSLGGGHAVVGFSTASSNSRFRFNSFTSEGQKTSDSTAQGMFGIHTLGGNLTIGGMILSKVGDSVLNLAYSPDRQIGRMSYGVGVQDAFNTGGSSGEAIDVAEGGGNSRSFYFAGTYEFGKGVYASLGTGSQRFKGLFGNASASMGRYAKAVIEYDTFNWNFGVAGSTHLFHAPVVNKELSATMFLGFIRGKYAMWSINFSF